MAAESSDPETAVCGFQEALAFWMWSTLAGSPNPNAGAAYPNVEALEHRTRDGRLLRGFKLSSTASGGAIKGKLLVAQGNAMLADQLLGYLASFARAGLETYVFDYRGYGASEGRARLKAIVGDYAELFEAIEPRELYGISFGGVVMMNLIGTGVDFERAVIDSAPARVSGFGCPERYDPAANFPSDAGGLLIIAGEQDDVVPAEDVRELLRMTQARGGLARLGEDFGHPFTDPDGVHRRRLELIRSFILDRAE